MPPEGSREAQRLPQESARAAPPPVLYQPHWYEPGSARTDQTRSKQKRRQGAI